MANIPHSWEAYARLQRKLSSVGCISTAAAIEEALNVVHQPDFRPENLTDDDLHRMVETASRRDRHRALLLRDAFTTQIAGVVATAEADDGEIEKGPRSLDDEVHARRELAKLRATLREPDWELLTGVAAGVSYEELSAEQATSTTALRSRVCRLRRAIG